MPGVAVLLSIFMKKWFSLTLLIGESDDLLDELAADDEKEGDEEDEEVEMVDAGGPGGGP